MKVIKMNTPDGQYTLPLIKVAKNRANAYANTMTDEWNSEVYFVMNDDFEGIDWLINNTNYEDWEDETNKLNNEVNVTMEDFWCSSDDFEIIETD